jgi:membrane protease subunit HflC
MSGRLIAWLVASVVAGILLSQTFFVVGQTEEAVVTQFGEPQDLINEPGDEDPGLKIKIPFFQNVTILPKINLVIEPPQAEVICSDNNRLIVDAFVRYRIADPLKFYRTLHTKDQADVLVQPLINSSLREVLGGATQQSIISTRRAEMMALIMKDLSARAQRQGLGIQIIDVRIKRADYPTANQQAVFRRMSTGFEQQAAQNRAQGEQAKRTIMAEADKQVTITIAEATQQASAIRGEGDAKRAAIYAASFGKDASFAAFWRSMEAYQISLANGDTTMVLSPDSDFFKYFKNGPGSR